MDGMSELFFGRTYGVVGMMFAALQILSTALMCAAAILVGRRNQVGWWMVAASFLPSSAGALLSSMSALPGSPGAWFLNLLCAGILLLLGAGIGALGHLSFLKFPPVTPTTRNIALRPFRASDLLLPLLAAAVFSVSSVLSLAASQPRIGNPMPVGLLAIVAVTSLLGGLLAAGLIGLAQRSRWAWFLVFASSLLGMAGATISAGGAVLMFLYLVLAAASVCGWRRWGAIAVQPAKVTGAI